MSAVSRSVRNSAVARPGRRRSGRWQRASSSGSCRWRSGRRASANSRVSPRRQTARRRRSRAATSRSRSSRPGSGSRVRSRSGSRARPCWWVGARRPGDDYWCTSRDSRIRRGARGGGPSPAGPGRRPGGARRGRARRPSARPVVPAAGTAAVRRNSRARAAIDQPWR
jgi:hypothetical protein